MLADALAVGLIKHEEIFRRQHNTNGISLFAVIIFMRLDHDLVDPRAERHVGCVVPPLRRRVGSFLRNDGGVESDAENGEQPGGEMGYQQTLMYGRYSKDLGDFAKEEARKAAEDRKRMRAADAERARELRGATKVRGKCWRRSARVVTWVWKHTFAKIGEDWVFLAVLGVIMAVVSFAMDYGIETCVHSR